jgi:hypothetical protein
MARWATRSGKKPQPPRTRAEGALRILNHRTYARSERPGRVGRSPAELLTGRSHPHWLELLGFERFRRSPAIA